jgi:hypothetical protein
MDQRNDIFFILATAVVSETIILILIIFRTNCLDINIKEILIYEIITINNEIMTSLQSYNK